MIALTAMALPMIAPIAADDRSPTGRPATHSTRLVPKAISATPHIAFVIPLTLSQPDCFGDDGGLVVRQIFDDESHGIASA